MKSTSMDATSAVEAVSPLEQLQKRMLSANDPVHADKMQQLIDKMATNQVYITFCGHFSAGKSSLINHLCGHVLLPSSPIPTSANVVTIQYGEEQVLLRKKNEPLQQAVALSQLEQYCTDGTQIESVDIRFPIEALKNNITLLDTPGIDSNDEQHMQSTLSALHLADCVFYVMDYNHVQSEVNFHFVKRLQDLGKPLYLIVNQIDKHDEGELAFDTFRKGVQQSFEDWQIKPQSTLYISLKNLELEYNELEQLKQCIQELGLNGPALRRLNAYNGAKQLIAEHVKTHTNINVTSKQAQQTRSANERLQQEIAKSVQAAQEAEHQTKKQIQSLLDNANIIPARTRELAYHYLQSCKPGFKAGLFFGASKTLAVKKERLERFHRDLVEQVKVHIDVHLHRQLAQIAEAAGCLNEQMMRAISALQVDVTSQWLQQQVQASGVFSDEYTMNFTKQVSAQIKEQYRKQAFALITPIQEAVQSGSDTRVAELEAEAAALLPILHAIDYESELLQCIAAELPQISLPTISNHRTGHSSPARRTAQSFLVNNKIEETMSGLQPAVPQEGLREGLEHAVRQLREAYKTIEPVPMMETTRQSLANKAERLENSQMTIALFGAFSAGKSSFANALIGERILPVSPSPMTAAINRISAPKKGHKHRTAKIVMKTSDQLWQEVAASMKPFDCRPASIQDAMEMIRSLKSRPISGKLQAHFAFLRAVEQGWTEAEPLLGSELNVSLEQFTDFVANEAKSCFVQVIELYYACPLTEAGFILVDTPGADSIHARHTGVAFEYIKNADVILFVTYYNHAFSQADQDFLMQLGRVKDSFELDKMFFVINAADLAASDEQLKQVQDHLESNLLQFGIREPQIYALSSKQALLSKQLSNQQQYIQSGFPQFEAAFIRFTKETLLQLAIQSAKHEIVRAAQILQQRVEAAQGDQLERAYKVQQIKAAHQAMVQHLLEENHAEELAALEKEIQQQSYYIKQRIQFRFGESFHLAFNPADLSKEQRQQREALGSAYMELIKTISFQCSQELLAVTLRIENFIHQLTKNKLERRNGRIREELAMFEPAAYTAERFATPELQQQLQPRAIDEKRLVQQFKNAKQFFEGGGKDRMRELLETEVLDEVGKHLQQQAEFLTRYYQKQLVDWLEHSYAGQLKLLDEAVAGHLFVLEQKADISDWQARKANLEQSLVYM